MSLFDGGAPPNDAPALVCVMPRPADMTRAQTEGWYRIPLARALRRLAADYLAFYQTGAFGAERWSIRVIAAVQRIDILQRRVLLPEEPTHPRADERYYQFTIGPLEALPAPICSRRLRRITFIPTTLARLLYARDVADLWIAAPPATNAVWGAGIKG
jgi:hypothetical protein